MSVFALSVHVSSVSAESAASVLDYIITVIRTNEDLLGRISRLALEWQPFIVASGMASFLFFARNAPRVYGLVFSESPLKKWRAGGVRDEHIELIRRALFFYFLYLFYLVVQFPLTFENSNVVAVVFNLAVQLMLLVLVLWRVSRVKSSLNIRHVDDEKKQETVGIWLDNQLSEVGITFATLRRKVVWLFLLSFSLVFAQNTPLLTQVLLWVLERVRTGLT